MTQTLACHQIAAALVIAGIQQFSALADSTNVVMSVYLGYSNIPYNGGSSNLAIEPTYSKVVFKEMRFV